MTLSAFLPLRRLLQPGLLLVAMATLALPARAADDFLPPEQAFRFSAVQIDGQTVEVKFAIADGYYMYRERLAVAADPPPSRSRRWNCLRAKSNSTRPSTRMSRRIAMRSCFA